MNGSHAVFNLLPPYGKSSARSLTFPATHDRLKNQGLYLRSCRGIIARGLDPLRACEARACTYIRAAQWNKNVSLR